ncbi:MAG: hypothetical protein KatS3mg083_080 [Candidatus Dojkabacteria bacterium]|nr:MAG: hypothetical protein KatS3mg083_080 [Candidatus Dojkabacteria bacterium]
MLFTGNLSGKNRNKLSFIFENILLNKQKNSRITKSYQYFGLWIAHNLNDIKNISLYIKLAKEQERTLLESALSYVEDYPNAKSKAKLFFWYLKGKLRKTGKTQSTTKSRKIKGCELALCPNKKIHKIFRNSKSSSLKVITKPPLNGTNGFKDTCLPVVKFERDFCIGIYKLDFYFKTNQLGVDLVDKLGNESLSGQTYIAKKRSFLESMGIKYLRIDKEHVVGDVEKYLVQLISSL